MQLRFMTALIVFIGSYLPLSLILLAQNFDFGAAKSQFCWPLKPALCHIPIESPLFSIGLLILTATCFGITVLALGLVRPSIDIDVVQVEYLPTDLMNYTLPYIVSFMNLDYQNTGEFIGILVFLAWMFWLTFRAGLIILNPVLIALGWRLYSINYKFAGSEDIFTAKALVRGHLALGRYKHYPLQEIQIVKP